MANPTIAKSVAFYFFDKKKWKATGQQIAITINQAKHLLDAGFSEEEIKKGIDYFIDIAPPKGGMYSLGFLNSTLNQALDVIKVEEVKKIQETYIPKVKQGGDSTENNRRKLQRDNHESRLGKRYNLDLFKES